MRTARVTLVCCCLGALSWGCSQASFSRDRLPEWEISEPVSIEISLSHLGLNSGAEIWVAISAGRDVPIPDPLVLVVPSRWAGSGDLRSDLGEIEVFDENGSSVAFREDADRVVIAHGGAQTVYLNYQVLPRAREVTVDSRFHAIGGSEVFFGYGRNIFVRPLHPGFYEGTVLLRFMVPQAESSWASTFGVFSDGEEIEGIDYGHLMDAAFLAGRIRVVADGSSTRTVTVAADPYFELMIDDALETIRTVVAQTVIAFGEPPFPTTIGLILHRPDREGALTGSGRPGGFVVELGDGVDPTAAEFAELVAHENLHRYLGFAIQFAPESELSMLWFKEGVTEYLATQLVVSAGFATYEWFLERIGRAATAYELNPWTGRSNEDEEEYWADSELRRFPYDQGFLLALLLDIELRRVGDRLDRAVWALLRSTRSFPVVRNSDLQEFFEERLGRDCDDLFGRYVDDGQRLPIAEMLAEVGIRLEREQVHYEPVALTVELETLMGWQSSRE